MMVHDELPVLEFSAQDRCDACGAQAHALARQTEFGELLFCIHHLRDSYHNLLDEGWEVIEDQDAIQDLFDRTRYPAPV